MRKSIVEALECRRMMAHVNTGEFGGAEAFVFPNSPVNLSGGVLTITGSSHADSITVGRETAPVLESLSEVPLADGSRLDLVRMEVPQAMHGGTPVTAVQVTALHPASTLAAGPYIRVHFAHGTGNNDYYVVASQVSSINISTGAGNDHIIVKKVGVPAI
ncbi:MAG TPA: hypothetical protein VKK61_11340, partial [Tepidisphaeraceae bacterium]|nr:hypothetical protein [Tepidisphaeraceae bacterium]